MKNLSLKSIFAPVLAMIIAMVFATQVSAMNPGITFISNSNGTIQTTVYADPNASIILDYYSGGQLMGAGIIGTTNFSGYYTGTINTYQYNIPSGAQVLVVVNGQQSATTPWPNTGYNGSYGNNVAPLLSQNSLNMIVGQNGSVTVSGNGYNNYNQYYIANSSNNVANATISGNTVSVYAVNAGTTTISVCSNSLVNTISYGLGNYSGSCTSLYVTVTGNNYIPPVYTYPTYPTYPAYPTYPSNNYNYSSPISVSNSNVQVTVGNVGTVNLYSGYSYNNNGYNNSSYYVTTNNNSVATATINGSVLTIYGTNPGNTTVTVCGTNGSQCATINVTVIAPTYYVNNGGYNNYQNQNGNWYYSGYNHCWMHR